MEGERKAKVVDMYLVEVEEKRMHDESGYPADLGPSGRRRDFSYGNVFARKTFKCD